MNRIVVVGSAGAGKTTIAAALAARLAVPHVELDALHWGPNWAPAEREVFRARVAAALSGNAWTTDGNYSAVRDLTWGRADTLVWLDFPLSLIMWRLLRRTVRRVRTRQELWNGNRERLVEQFFSRDSLFLWALKTHRRRQREYPRQFQQPQYSHLRVLRFRSPRAAARWLDTVWREPRTP